MDRDKDRIYINNLMFMLEQLKLIKGNVYLCDLFAKRMCSEANITILARTKAMNNYPKFQQWVVEVGRKYRKDYMIGEPWTYDPRECIDDFPFDEEDENEDGTIVFQYLSNKDKIKELTEYINKLEEEFKNKYHGQNM
jgi:hypothetical protein